MTKIYTKTGDRGETGLLGGVRVPKTDPRIETYGTLDELNASLGMVIALLETEERKNARTENSLSIRSSVPPFIRQIQADLFSIGAYLATPAELRSDDSPVTGDRVKELEGQIDAWQATLPPLTNFILPGGSVAGAALHVARTVNRRAERRLVALATTETLPNTLLTYVNRLSDFLFVAARIVNHERGVSETLWGADASRS